MPRWARRRRHRLRAAAAHRHPCWTVTWSWRYARPVWGWDHADVTLRQGQAYVRVRCTRCGRVARHITLRGWSWKVKRHFDDRRIEALVHSTHPLFRRA